MTKKITKNRFSVRRYINFWEGLALLFTMLFFSTLFAIKMSFESRFHSVPDVLWFGVTIIFPGFLVAVIPTVLVWFLAYKIVGIRFDKDFIMRAIAEAEKRADNKETEEIVSGVFNAKKINRKSVEELMAEYDSPVEEDLPEQGMEEATVRLKLRPNNRIEEDVTEKEQGTAYVMFPDENRIEILKPEYFEYTKYKTVEEWWEKEGRGKFPIQAPAAISKLQKERGMSFHEAFEYLVEKKVLIPTGYVEEK